MSKWNLVMHYSFTGRYQSGQDNFKILFYWFMLRWNLEMHFSFTGRAANMASCSTLFKHLIFFFSTDWVPFTPSRCIREEKRSDLCLVRMTTKGLCLVQTTCMPKFPTFSKIFKFQIFITIKFGFDMQNISSTNNNEVVLEMSIILLSNNFEKYFFYIICILTALHCYEATREALWR